MDKNFTPTGGYDFGVFHFSFPMMTFFYKFSPCWFYKCLKCSMADFYSSEKYSYSIVGEVRDSQSQLYVSMYKLRTWVLSKKPWRYYPFVYVPLIKSFG